MEAGFLAPVMVELDAQGGLQDVVGGIIDSLNAQLGVRNTLYIYRQREREGRCGH